MNYFRIGGFFSAGVLLCCSMQALAAAVQPVLPDAGQSLREIAPESRLLPQYSGRVPLPISGDVNAAAPAPGGDKIKVSRFDISGARLFPVARLQALLQSYCGQELDLAGLYAVAQKITIFYRQQGYLLARAWLPAQDVQQGVVKLVILEGYYQQVQLQNHSQVRDGVFSQFLKAFPEKSPVDANVLQRQLLLLDDIPGVVIHSTLRPGSQTGYSDLEVEATSGERVRAQVGSDNWGERFTGAIRAFASADLLNPLGLGDHLNAYVMDTQYGGTKYGRASYDVGTGGSGVRWGTSYERLNYLLAQDYNALHAYGSADTSSIYGLWPWIRRRETNVTLQITYDHRILHDEVASVGSSDAKWFQVGTLSLNGSQQFDRGQMALWNMSVTHGDLQLDPETLLHDRMSYNTAGAYNKLNIDGSLLWPVWQDWSVFGHVQGQRAAKNLDLAEKISLGGPNGVRAYPMGEVQADDAVTGTMELRYNWSTAMQLWVFCDAGYGHSSHQPMATDVLNRRSIAGPGVGGSLEIAKGLSMRTDWAWPAGSPAISAPTERPTIWWRVTQSF